jgi:hypothetical protein
VGWISPFHTSAAPAFTPADVYVTLSRATTRDILYISQADASWLLSQVHEAVFAANAAAAQAARP